jgi:hypothetical protein
MRVLAALLPALVLAAHLRAQEFQPPELGGDEHGSRIGLYGFGVRGGVDFTDRGRLALGATLDLGRIATARLRPRATFALSVFNGPNVYVGSADLLYRFAADDERAVPYIGAGASLVGAENCSSAPDCPTVWVNVVLGFELRFRPAFNWLLEYHGMDWLRENRIYAGLTTRRGG